MRTLPLILIIVLLTFNPAHGREVKRDPSSGIIRVIYIGMPFAASPYQVFKTDPLLSTLPIQGNLYGISASDVQRSMRLYMPRTRDSMVRNFDIIGLDDTTYGAFPMQTIQWMAESCLEDGMGLFMAGGFESFGGGAGFPSWDNTALKTVLPVECGEEYGPDGRSNIVEFEDEFVKSVPWEGFNEHNVFGGYNVVRLKDGAKQISTMTRLSLGGGTDPGWVWWDIGEGRFFASAPGFRGGSADRGFIRWKHYPDFVSNMVYFLAGLTPPSDVNLLYTTRATFRDIQDLRQTISGLLDFISKFGADTRKVDEKLAESEEALQAARRSFVDLELEESKAGADEVLEMLNEAYALAFQARDDALFWIFLTEWLAVTATGLICGFVVWTLMIRRRLYREVRVTREAR
jgi:hypothetical protein